MHVRAQGRREKTKILQLRWLEGRIQLSPLFNRRSNPSQRFSSWPHTPCMMHAHGTASQNNAEPDPRAKWKTQRGPVHHARSGPRPSKKRQQYCKQWAAWTFSSCTFGPKAAEKKQKYCNQWAGPYQPKLHGQISHAANTAKQEKLDPVLRTRNQVQCTIGHRPGANTPARISWQNREASIHHMSHANTKTKHEHKPMGRSVNQCLSASGWAHCGCKIGSLRQAQRCASCPLIMQACNRPRPWRCAPKYPSSRNSKWRGRMQFYSQSPRGCRWH